MHLIVPPVNPESRRPDIENLQHGLLLLLERGALPVAEEERERLATRLKTELRAAAYRTNTRKLIIGFQEQRGLQGSGVVDERTAEVLNALLREHGAFEGSPGQHEEPSRQGEEVAPARFVIVCRVVDARDEPIAGLRVEMFDTPADAPAVGLAEPTVTDADGTAQFLFVRADAANRGPDLSFTVHRSDVLLAHAVQGEHAEEGVIRHFKPRREPIALKVERHRLVTGTIVRTQGTPAAKLKLFARHIGFGGEARVLGDVGTDEQGRYALTYDPGRGPVNLEIAISDPQDAERTVPLMKPRLAATAHEVLNLVAPAAGLKAEYSRLREDLTPHVGSMERLKEARETPERPDLSMLNRASGWDARLIALAAVAERLVADEDVALPKEAMYGLLRAGLPSDKRLLAQVEPDVAVGALKASREAGIIEMSDAQLAAARTSFTRFANDQKLATVVPGSGSTYTALIESSGLESESQSRFASVFLNHRGEAAKLWDAAREAGLKPAEIGALRLQGKLAFLTGNSAGMTARLVQKQLQDPVALIDQDFDRATAWSDEIYEQANIPRDRRGGLTDADRRALDALIPTAYIARKPEERLDAYAEDMARKIRLSYPTQVVGRMIERNEIRLPQARGTTAKILKRAAAQGFRLGETPVEAFLGTHSGVLKDLDEADQAALPLAQQQLKMLHRLYQATPSNEAIPVLMEMGVTSAYDVMELDAADFVKRFAEKYLEIHGKAPPPSEAQTTLDRSKQVSSVVYNLFTVARKLESELPVMGMAAPAPVRERVRNDLVKQFPTMESLFGTMDYCECEQCRSVLSPAAYLVDLLQSLEEWGSKRKWPATSDSGRAYVAPYDALIARRPDLPFIPLTCENTHTALPYIDLVNEILEYYVARGKLDEQAAHDTGDATTPELLAEPQNVMSDAYEKLRGEVYPLGLPFDLWVETVRQFCEHFEVPLHRLLETFRTSEQLFAPKQGFDRASICAESLGLAPSEVAILTDPNGFPAWSKLYGYTTARPVLQSPGTEVRGDAEYATLSLADDDAKAFASGDPCICIEAGTSASRGDTRVILEIGDPGSAAAGRTKIVFEGKWAQPPVAGDRLAFDAHGALRSAKALSRRLGVTYKEIVDIVRTGFVNPRITELGVLYKLGVSIRDARFYQERKAFYDSNKSLIGTERSALQPAEQLRFDELAGKDPVTQRTGWEDLYELDAFEQRLAGRAADFHVSPADVQAAVLSLPFHEVLVLADEDSSCNFDKTWLQYADGTPADDFAFLRINLFVRLWRKLGWSIEDIGRALTAFIPSAARQERDAQKLADWLKTALIYLSHLEALEERLKPGKGRSQLLALWSDLSTDGEQSLYAQLFLTRGVLKNDGVFDHPYGRYLDPSWIEELARSRLHEVYREGVPSGSKIDPGPFSSNSKLKLSHDGLRDIQRLSFRGILGEAHKSALKGLLPGSQLLAEMLDEAQQKAAELSLLRGHLPALQGALGLSSEEIRRILEEETLSLDEAPLSMANVSLLHRYRLLAGAMKLSIAALLSLEALSGCNPFTRLHGEPLEAIEDDHPFSGTLRFVEIAEEVRASGLSIEDLEYLLRHRFDAVGKYRSNASAMLLLLKTLGDGVRAVRDEHATPDTPDLPTEDLLRQKLGLSFSPEVVERFISMLNGAAIPGETMREDFEKYFLKRESPLGGTAGFLDAGDYEELFGALEDAVEVAPGASQQEVDEAREANERARQVKLQERRLRAARAYLPFLQRRLVRQLAVQTMQTQTGADPALVESLITDKRVLGGTAPLLDVLATTGDVGLSATFYSDEDFGGQATAVSGVTDADTALKIRRSATLEPIKPNNADSATFAGYLTVPATGAYRFYIQLEKAQSEAHLHFDHLPQAHWLGGTAEQDKTLLSAEEGGFLELTAGTPYRFELKINKLRGGDVRLFVQGDSVPRGPLASLELYPSEPLVSAVEAVERLGKVLQLAQGLGLNARELRHLQIHGEDFGGLDLNELPIRADELPGAQERAIARFGQFLRLAAYSRLKRDLAVGRDDLIDVFELDEQAEPEKRREQVYGRLAAVARRDATTVRAVARALFRHDAGFAGNGRFFKSEQPLSRLWNALQVVERFGVPVETLLDWTRIVATETDSQQGFGIAQGLKSALKARYAQDAWQRVAQPIFDGLRQRQRDALVSHVMHQRGFERLEQLYEYFLADPGMEPVVQTSRIRLAIASVQLFVQQCLLNLAPEVHPVAIDAKQWEWLKRYRVWEANRKIFLFPENWLEPEFRDDKTHLFSELEGALLQGDVSSDLVEDAFLTYLRKLDELARLDIVAMHIQDNIDAMRRVLHVFGRTFTQPYRYFYRRYARQMWTPWEPVNAEIEGDHLAPVIWRDRLYLFWVTFLEKPEAPAASIAREIAVAFEPAHFASQAINAAMNATGSSPEPKSAPASKPKSATLAELTLSGLKDGSLDSSGRKTIEAQLHWSEYVRGEWSSRESGGYGSSQTVAIYGQYAFDSNAVLVHVSKETPGEDGEERGVFIHLGRPFEKAFYLAGRNSAPRSQKGNPDPLLGKAPDNPFSASARILQANRYAGNSGLVVSFHRHLTTESGASNPPETQRILKDTGPYTLVLCNNNITELRVLASDPAVQGAADPGAVAATINNGLGEIGSLVKPFFFQDEARRRTLFVEPDLVERTTENWKGWVPVAATPQPQEPKARPLTPFVPLQVIPRLESVFDPPPIDQSSLLAIAPRRDWLVNEITAVAFHDKVIGPEGWTGLEIRKPLAAAGNGALDITASGALVPGTAFVMTERRLNGGLEPQAGINLVGAAGFNAAQAQRLADLNGHDVTSGVIGLDL